MRRFDWLVVLKYLCSCLYLLENLDFYGAKCKILYQTCILQMLPARTDFNMSNVSCHNFMHVFICR